MKKEIPKIPEYYDCVIKEKIADGFYCTIRGKEEQKFLRRRDFLDPNDVAVGDVWRFYRNDRNNTYSYFSNLFNKNYLKSKFKDKMIYEGYIYSELQKEYIVKVSRDAYIRIPKKNFINKIEIGDSVTFYTLYNKLGSVIADLNKPILIDLSKKMTEEKIDKIKLQVLDVDPIEKNEKILGYNYLLLWNDGYDNIKFKLFLKSGAYDKINGLEDNSYYLERNYEIISTRLKIEEVFIYFRLDKFSYEKNKIFFYLDVLSSFKELLYEEGLQPAELIFYVLGDNFYNFYVERKDIGTFKLNTSKYSLVELTLLEKLNKKFVYLELERNYINIVQFQTEEDINEEISDVVITNRFETFSKKIIYQLAINGVEDKRNYRMFIEDKDIDYLGEIFPIGYNLGKLKLKYSVKNLFNFYTRLPYIENPLVSILKDKKIGDVLYARVKKIRNNFIEILVEDKYKKIIPQSKLKQIEKFEIDSYYTEGKLSEFYIEDITKDDVSLLGYNPEKIKKIFDGIKSLSDETEGELIECHVKESVRGLEGVYEEAGEYLEVFIPSEEISYIDIDYKFEPNKRYLFRVIEKGLPSNPYGLLASRKRISKSIKNELEAFYPLGSIIGGIYFSQDEEGFYFNLTDKEFKINMGDLVGYLPFNKIGLYPDIEKFKSNILSNSYAQYKILNYPKNINSLNIREKAIELEMIKSPITLNDVLKDTENDNFTIDLTRKNSLHLLSYDEEKLYFEKEILGENIVFSIDEAEFNRLENLYDNFKKNTENTIYKELFKIFKNENQVELSFKEINEKNNTIELSLDKKIKKILLNTEVTFKQNINKDLLFEDEILNIPILVENRESFTEEYQQCKIKDIIDGKIILEIFINDEELLNKEYKIKITKKEEDLYLGTLNNKIFIINSPYILNIGEEVNCIVTNIEGDKFFAELKIEKELNKNCANYIENYIEENIENLSLEELKNIIDSNPEKYKYINILNKYKSLIYTGYKLNKYLFLKEEFSNGAFGKVYKGVNLLTDEKVILKRYCSDKNQYEYKSFQGEGKLLEELGLPSVMRVFYRENDEYVGEYIEGKTFREFLKEENTFDKKLDLIMKVASALIDIHDKGIYHLDIKPENIMIDVKGNIKLIDFGGSQSKYEKYGKFGTLIYSSPKQCIAFSNGNTETIFSEKDDIYSFGIVMYETFTGKPPYSSELGDDGIIAGHKKGRYVEDDVEYKYINPRKINEEISEKLENIINKCLEPEEEKRYESMDDIIFELEDLI